MKKNKDGPKKVQCDLELDRGRLARGTQMARTVNKLHCGRLARGTLANKLRGLCEQTAGVVGTIHTVERNWIEGERGQNTEGAPPKVF